MFFIEKLKLRTWFFSVFPRLLFRRLETGRSPGHCYFIDGTRLGILGARLTAWIGRVPIEKLGFRLVDVRDEEGLLLRLRIAYRDLAEVQADVMKDPRFRDAIGKHLTGSRIPSYLAKSIARTSLTDSRTIWHALLLVQISNWTVRGKGSKNGGPVLFLELRPWAGAIERYALRHGVSIIAVSPPFQLNLRALVYWLIGPKGIETLRILRGGLRHWRLSLFSGRRIAPANGHSSLDLSSLPLEQSSDARASSTPRVGVEYYGHFNLNHPEFYSDLFFWQQSSLSGNDVLVTFALPQDPLDKAKWRELDGHGIRMIALHPQATTIPEVLPFRQDPSPGRMWADKPRLLSARGGLEEVWLKEQLSGYRTAREYWAGLFRAENIKVYISWYKHDPTHCAIADAIQSVGGIAVIYQRSCELDPSPGIAADTDIMFGFSSADAEVKRRSGSRTRYHVTTGYLGDHRFALLQGVARNARNALRNRGAERIVAFLDENSADDSRWHTGHEFMRENYAFLLEKVLAESWLGLVLKPKTPKTLRRRLGPVADLLDQALATGRCYMYEGGVLQGKYPPAAAALGADVAVHGHLCAATGGLEAALAGVPTLLMDREGWSISSLYRLGVGRVVFTDWRELWGALTEHWAGSRGTPGFGDWSSMLDELDPFRDGRAAERMGTYIQWLIEGFKAGLDRYTVMADAAERYCAMWGRDKVTEVNSRSWSYSNGRDYIGGGLQASTSRPTPMDRITSQFQQRS